MIIYLLRRLMFSVNLEKGQWYGHPAGLAKERDYTNLTWGSQGYPGVAALSCSSQWLIRAQGLRQQLNKVTSQEKHLHCSSLWQPQEVSSHCQFRSSILIHNLPLEVKCEALRVNHASLTPLTVSDRESIWLSGTRAASDIIKWTWLCIYRSH